MKKPKMILCDYGQTLIAEQKFDGVNGTVAILKYATKNKYNLTAEQVQSKASAINQELGRYNPRKRHLVQIEVPNTMFTPYLYESQGIEVPPSNEEMDTIFWNAAAPEEVWYIGDQYECDIKGALNAGLFPVWYIGAIDLPYTENKNILTVKSWNDLWQRMEM